VLAARADLVVVAKLHQVHPSRPVSAFGRDWYSVMPASGTRAVRVANPEVRLEVTPPASSIGDITGDQVVARGRSAVTTEVATTHSAARSPLRSHRR
jgi:hypothetical protein